MTFPVVQSFSQGTTAGGTTHVMTLPTGIVAGDLIVVIMTVKNASVANFPAGWTLFGSVNVGSSPDARGQAGYRVADGTEGATVATSGGSTICAYHIYRLSSTSGVPVHGGWAGGFDANPNPPNLVSGFGVVDTLWLAVAYWNNTSANVVNSYPSGYTNGAFEQQAVFNNPAVATARKQTTAASEDPGTFNLNFAPWVSAGTIAIKGGAGGGGGGGGGARSSIVIT